MGAILMVAGPPGAGKSTVSRKVAESHDGPVMRIEGDAFWHFFVKPKDGEPRENFRLMLRAMTAACLPFARADYLVVLDFSIPPRFLAAARTIVKDLDLHYVMLRPSLAVCEARAGAREVGKIEDYSGFREFYTRFETEVEAHIIQDDEADTDAIVQRVREGFEAGRFRVP